MFRITMSRTTVVLSMLAGLTFVGVNAVAYTPGACQADADKLCPGVSTKEQTACLKQHEAELSMECKVNLAEAREVIRDTFDACEPDIKKHCAGVQKGKGRIRQCLRDHESELTTACKDQIHAARKKYQVLLSTTTANVESSTTTK